MTETKTFKFNKSDIYIFFILFPFMYPRGFSEYFSGYKIFFTLWLYGVVGIIFMYFLFKLFRGCNRYKECTPFILLYFGYFAIITLVLQGGISQGIQKVFVTPALCLFCIICFREKIIQFVRCLVVILIINFVLNVTVFSPWMCPQYFNVDKHLIFIGHVQIGAQLGILGIFVGYLCHRYLSKILGYILMVMSIVTMFMSDTAAAKIALVLFALLLFISKIKVIRSILFVDTRYYVMFWLIINFAILTFYSLLNGKYVIGSIDFSLSGRAFIWKNCLELIKQNIATGYGAYGVLIKVFWNEEQGTEGMNYAHNELLQRLLDGGVVLLILFVLLLCFIVKEMKKVGDRRLKAISNICLMITFILMLVESVTEYYYIYIFLILYANVEKFDKKGKNYGNNSES